MSLHQHSILKTKTYQKNELTSAQHSEEETHHYQQQTAVDDTGLIYQCVEQSFIHTFRQFCKKYRTFSTDFMCVQLLRYKHIPNIELFR
jgi:hypothetical protein